MRKGQWVKETTPTNYGKKVPGSRIYRRLESGVGTFSLRKATRESVIPYKGQEETCLVSECSKLRRLTLVLHYNNFQFPSLVGIPNVREVSTGSNPAANQLYY